LAPRLRLDRPWQAQLVSIVDGAGREIDSAVAIPYRQPRSYTGEDMVELTVHGSPYLVRTILEGSVAAGCRLAEAGEFTRRALANGKMDLLQAEGVRDLIEAETALQADNARRLVGGQLSRRMAAAKEQLLALLARVEGALDFAEQGVAVPRQELEDRLQACRDSLCRARAGASAGRHIRDGIRIVISGPQNAGKSTLFNYLLKNERAIVSARPGTTRDLVEGDLEIGGARVTLVDTAGLGEAGAGVEEEAMRRARAARARAAAVIELWPADQAQPPTSSQVVDEPTVLRVLSKRDLAPERALETGWTPLSVVTGHGLGELRTALEQVVGALVERPQGEVAIAARHDACLRRAVAELEGCDLGQLELAAESLRWALRTLEELTGAVTTDDLLDMVFSTFCLGK
jgi:tRNA modification GTPase